jgi:GNAT superfamily N-acetyltransferase
MDTSIEYKIAMGNEAQEVVNRMLSSSRTSSEARLAVDVFTRFTRQYHINADRQPVALLNGQMIGYVLVLVNPGAVATVLLPSLLPELEDRNELSYRDIMIRLLKLLGEQIEPWDLGIIQAVLSGEDEKSFKSILLESGFSFLCDLAVMESSVAADHSAVTIENIDWVPFNDTTAQRFEQVILQSYQDSKDCPALTGLRTGPEILESHRWSGIFLKKGWWLMQYQGRDAGVVLLNGTQEKADRLDLIYMGLARWARGRGLGRAIMNKAFETATTLKKKNIRLAVERDNFPAKRIYDEFGFREVNQQVVFAILNEKRRQRLQKNETGVENLDGA